MGFEVCSERDFKNNIEDKRNIADTIHLFGFEYFLLFIPLNNIHLAEKIEAQEKTNDRNWNSGYLYVQIINPKKDVIGDHSQKNTGNNKKCPGTAYQLGVQFAFVAQNTNFFKKPNHDSYSVIG